MWLGGWTACTPAITAMIPRKTARRMAEAHIQILS
jgi:hypothetical protein